MGLGCIGVFITHVMPFYLRTSCINLIVLTLNLNAFNLADLNANAYTTLHILKYPLWIASALYYNIAYESKP